jgi:hypothetical protein
MSKYEPRWKEELRLTAHCPRCARRYVQGRPEWRTCLQCEVNPQWTLVTAAEFYAKAKEMFPGSVELPIAGDRDEPHHHDPSESDHDDDDLGQLELAA